MKARQRETILWDPQPQQRPTKGHFWKDEEFWEIIEKQMLRNESLEDQKCFIESVGIVLNAIPRREHENKGRQWGVSAEVKLCQPELRSDERTEADLCAKCKPAPACLKSPLSFLSLDVIISPVGHVPSVDSLLVWRHYFFHSHPSVKASPNRQRLWNGTFVIWRQIRPFITAEQWQEFQCLDDKIQLPVWVKGHRNKWLLSTLRCVIILEWISLIM